MLTIRKKRIRNTSRHLPAACIGHDLYLSVNQNEHKARLKRIGFASDARPGDSILPRAVGPVSRYNAHGKSLILKTLEKIAVVHTRLRTYEQWCGRGQTKTVTEATDYTYFRYPRKHIPATLFEFVLFEDTLSQKITLLHTLPYTKPNDSSVLVAINLFLEIFGEVEIRTKPDVYTLPKVTRRVNWEILPPGEKFTPGEFKKRMHNRTKADPMSIEYERYTTINNLVPTFVAEGRGGFESYLAFIFKEKDIVFLETARYANATYIIGNENWETLSQLSKKELLELGEASRIIHNKNWEKKFLQFFHE